jgi:hypothetical protein
MLEKHPATTDSIPHSVASITIMKSTVALQKNVGFALLFVVAILPTLLVKIPPMGMYVLTTAGMNDANPYYQISWAVYSDLAMDIIVLFSDVSWTLKLRDGSFFLPLNCSSSMVRSRSSYRSKVVSGASSRLHLEFPFAGSRILRGLLVAEGCKIGRRHVKTLMQRINQVGRGISPTSRWRDAGRIQWFARCCARTRAD